MRQLPKQLSLLAVSVFAVGAVSVAPVFAEGGSGTSDSHSGTETTLTTQPTSTSVKNESETHTSVSGTSDRGTNESTTSTKTEAEHESETENSTSGDLQERAKKLLAEKRHEGKTKTLAERQKSCDAHKAELTTREQNYAKASQRHLDTFNGIYSKVLAFQANKKLTATNFSQLKAAADAKKAAAEAAVTALSSTKVTIDCTSSDPAIGVAILKTAVSNSRAALQDYRAAIKDVIVALQSAMSTTTDATHQETN